MSDTKIIDAPQDEWSELERLAIEATAQGPYSIRSSYGDLHIDDPLLGSIMCDMQYYPWVPDESTMRFMAMASPAAILRLIAAARKGE